MGLPCWHHSEPPESADGDRAGKNRSVVWPESLILGSRSVPYSVDATRMDGRRRNALLWIQPLGRAWPGSRRLQPPRKKADPQGARLLSRHCHSNYSFGGPNLERVGANADEFLGRIAAGCAQTQLFLEHSFPAMDRDREDHTGPAGLRTKSSGADATSMLPLSLKLTCRERGSASGCSL